MSGHQLLLSYLFLSHPQGDTFIFMDQDVPPMPQTHSYQQERGRGGEGGKGYNLEAANITSDHVLLAKM